MVERGRRSASDGTALISLPGGRARGGAAQDRSRLLAQALKGDYEANGQKIDAASLGRLAVRYFGNLLAPGPVSKTANDRFFYMCWKGSPHEWLLIEDSLTARDMRRGGLESEVGGDMPRLPIDLPRKIKDILKHVRQLPDDARAPILHYRRTGADLWGSLGYVERVIDQGERYQAVVDRHLGRLYGMALVNLVETFERFLKEVASECVDAIANFVVDDRFNVFKIQGSGLASHFSTGTLGKSLCESATWLDCEEINDRFRRLLADPFQVGGQFFYVFPKQNQLPPGQQSRFDLMNLIWQIRHSAVHNVGVITQSDAVRLRLWAREPVSAPRILAPTRSDLNYLKRFLDETADDCNERIGDRLAQLLTTLHTDAPVLFVPQEIADRLTAIFRRPHQVAAAVGVLPPD